MKSFLIFLATYIVLAPSFAFAQAGDPLSVTFNPDPLFTETSLLPSAAADGTVTATNNTNETLPLFVTFVEIEQTGNAELAEVIRVTLTESANATEHTLAAWFALQDETLVDLAPNSSITYTVDAVFLATAGDEYQNSAVRFDICMGLGDGDVECALSAPPVDPDNDGNGGGGGNDDNDDTDDTPPGLIAGESTSTPTFTDMVIDPVVSFVRGMVLGESTTTDAATSADEAATTTEVYASDVTRTGSAAGVLMSNDYCTLWWLLLLVAISTVWSFYEDRYRSDNSVLRTLFTRNAFFAGVYVILLFLFQLIGILETFWWAFAAAWGIMTVLDYRAHYTVLGWSSAHRNLFFALASGFFIVTSFVFGFPCVWWPFFLIGTISALLYLVGDGD